MINFLQIKEASIQNIFSVGLSIKGRYIYKATNLGKNKEVAGILNDKTLHFYASNLPNGIEAKNYTYNQFNKLFSNDIRLTKDYSDIVNSLSDKAQTRVLKFEEYNLITNFKDHKFNLQILLDKFHSLDKKYITLPKIWSNISDIKGLKGNTFFPIIDFQNNFITAQSIPYNDYFKRDKTKFISWLHSNYDYKKRFGISTKITPEADICFYREHLVDLSKPTIIVEAPKTAEICALLFHNFNWIATVGSTRFNNLDTSFLDSNNTFVIPDNDKIKEWSEVANKKGLKTILSFYEITKSIEGFDSSDIADLIIPYLTEKNENIDNAFKLVYNAILSIIVNQVDASFEIDKNIIDATNELCFEVNQSKLKGYYISSIPSNLVETTTAIWKHSNPVGIRLNTLHFEVYKDDFQVLDAGFNIRKKATEQEFINNLKKSFLIIKHLNIDDDYLAYFDLIISNIQTNSAYKFNRNGINRLIKIFDTIPIEIALKYAKKRNYIYNGNTCKIDNLEFIKQLRQAQLKYKTWSQLHAIKKVVKKGVTDLKFITKADLGIKRKEESIYVSNLVDSFNIASLGTSSTRTAKVYLKVKTNIVPEHAHTNNSILGLHNLRYKNINVSKIANETGLLRKNINAFINIDRDVDCIKLLYKEISFYIENIDHLEFKLIGKYFECVSNILHYKDFVISEDSEAKKTSLPLMIVTPDIFGFNSPEMVALEIKRINEQIVVKTDINQQNQFFQISHFKDAQIIKDRIGQIIDKVYARDYILLSNREKKLIIFKNNLAKGKTAKMQWSKAEVKALENSIDNIKRFSQRTAS
jgi:hypothetical protein